MTIKNVLKNSRKVNSIYWKYVYCPTALQMDLSDLQPVSDTHNGYRIQELKTDSPPPV